MKTNNMTNKKMNKATIVLLVVLIMTIAAFIYQIKELVVNETMVQWNLFTIMFSMLTIGFECVNKNKKDKAK